MRNVWELIPMQSHIYLTWPARASWRPYPRVGLHASTRPPVPGTITRHPPVIPPGSILWTKSTGNSWSRPEPASGKWASVRALTLHIRFPDRLPEPRGSRWWRRRLLPLTVYLDGLFSPFCPELLRSFDKRARWEQESAYSIPETPGITLWRDF